MKKWPVFRLSELAEVRLGRQRSPKNHHGDQMRPYLRAANVSWAGLHLDDVNEMNFTNAEMDTYRLIPGDLLLNEASGSPGEVGKPALWNGEIADCAFQNTLLRVRSSTLEPKFLLHYFMFMALSGRFVEQSRGVGIHHLGRERLARWPMPLPPRAEQKRVVEILEEHLSTLNASRTALATAATRMKTLRSAVLEHLFGVGDASTVPLREYVSEISAGRSYGASAAPAGPDEWGIIKVSAMTSGVFRDTENKAVSAELADPRFQIRPRDLLVSRANTSEYVGASVLVPDDVRPRLLLSDKSLRIVPASAAVPEWLWRALQTPTARRQISQRATGTKDSMRNIPQDALLSIALPRTHHREQLAAVLEYREFDNGLRRLEQLTQSTQIRAEALRRSVLTAAFSGRLAGSGHDTEPVEEALEEEFA